MGKDTLKIAYALYRSAEDFELCRICRFKGKKCKEQCCYSSNAKDEDPTVKDFQVFCSVVEQDFIGLEYFDNYKIDYEILIVILALIKDVKVIISTD